MNDDEQQIECRAAVELPINATNKGEIPYLPAGIHEITPISGGIGRAIKVLVDPSAAVAMEERRQAIVNKGKRPFLDMNHDDNAASFRPSKFIWRDGEGVVCLGAWTGSGKKAVDGKDYCGFSPVFHVDNKRANPARVVTRLSDLSPNMGGLVNDPAFNALALWSKNDEQLVNAGVNGDNAETVRENMETEKDIAALRAKQEELQKEVEALKASAADDQKLSQSQVELRNIELEIEVSELKAKGDSLDKQVRDTNKKAAEASIKAAIQRGAILPKDTKTQTELIARATSDPSFNSIIAAMQGPGNQLTTRVTGGHKIVVQDEDPGLIFAAMARVTVNSKKSRKPEEKLNCAREFAALFAAECSVKASNRDRILAFPMDRLEDALIAADVTDSDLGTLSGTLVVQRTLELLKFEFPALGMFTTDFTSEQASFNQTIMTRTVGIPPVVDYNTSTGWATGIDAPVTTDVPITIDKHQAVPIAFNEQIMASTVRRLFDEQAPAQAYAMAKAMVDDLYSNITDANFTNNTVIATASFTRAIVNAVSTALTLRGVPLMLGNRTMLLYPTVFQKLMDDTVLMQLAAFQKPQLITDPTSGGVSLVLPVSNFQVVNAPNLPTNNGNVTGFAGSKSALCIASRLPNDYTKFAPGVSYGNVQTVTDPDLGISVMLTQYVDHTLATGNQRISLMYGTNAGQGDAGQLIKAATGSGSSRSN